jgi:hypothetical protein
MAANPHHDLPRPLLIGMVHLPALPGSRAFRLGIDEIIEHALGDARTLKQAGFEAVMVENFGDAPFTAGSLEPETIAAMAIVIRHVARGTGLIVGVNCLRNDARSALGIATATEASYIRVNVHTGVAATDQGVIQGNAYETVRERERLCPDVLIFADVHVKHAIPMSQPDIGLAAQETAYRGMADAIIVSGAGTGRPVDVNQIAAVKKAVPDRLVLCGSGATPNNIKTILQNADGAIVGTSLKPAGRIAEPIDAAQAATFINAAKA